MNTTTNLSPLWPQPIEVIGLTGEYASGKTLFGLTIDPKHTLVYDAEKSSGTYRTLGFDRIDIPQEVMKIHPNGYKPVQTFEWWLKHVRSLPGGKYRVIVLDPVSEIESGLTDWVRANPGHFGKTAGQYLKMSGLMWGDVKEYWKSILSDLSSRCETFVFTSHLTSVWKGETKTDKRKPKGKETLMELASLYLQVERKADAKGNVPAKPSAIVLKSRLAFTRFSEETGAIEILPALPPRLPEATPAAIRQYMLTPPDYKKLKKEELAPEELMSDDDRAQVRLATVEAERDTEALRLERLSRQEQAQQREQQRQQQQQPSVAPSAPTNPQPQGHATPPTSSPSGSSGPDGIPVAVAGGAGGGSANGSNDTQANPHGPVSHEQLSKLKELRDQLIAHGMPAAEWKELLVRECFVETALSLTFSAAQMLISRLNYRVEKLDMEADIKKASGQEGGEPESDESKSA